MSNPVRSAFIYLMHLAWKSRLHIPFLLTVCFLVFDIRLQLEVNINMTRRRAPHLIAGDNDNNENYGANNFNFDDDVDENNDENADGDDDDDDDDDEDDSSDLRANGITAEECKRICEQDMETISNIINILPSLSVPIHHSNTSSKVLLIRSSVFHQLSHAFDKHCKKNSIRSFEMSLCSVIFKSQNNHRCIL